MKVERLPSKHNDFEHLTDWVIHGVRRPYVLRIWCHQCGANDVAALTGGVHTVQQNLAEKIFARKGWHIGRRRKLDMCPHCVQRDREERNARRTAANAKTDPTIADIWPAKPVAANVIHLPSTSVAKDTPMTNHTKSGLTAVVEPREMTRADKRIIFNKLEEVYADETAGYTSGWSDQRVATDLGVPLDWVRALRDENFGPEGHSPEAKAIFDETRKLLDQARGERDALLAKANELVALAGKLLGELDRMERKLQQIEKGKL